jgi:hypothetical protein
MEVIQCIYSPQKPVPYSFFTDIEVSPGDLVVVESGGRFNPFGLAIVQVYRTENIPRGDAEKAEKRVVQKLNYQPE